MITSAEIKTDTTIPTPSASQIDTAPTSLNVLFAVVTTGAEGIRTIPCSNIIAYITPSIQEDNSSFVVGERNFKQYYNWVY